MRWVCYNFVMSDDYQIGSGMTEGQLKAASWWVRHRIALHGAGYMSLMALCLILWSYAAWTAVDVWVLSAPRESRLLSRVATNVLNQDALQAAQPQALQPGQAFRLTGTDERQDMLALLSNPNARWWAEFDYHFSLGDTQTPTRHSFVLPQSQQPLTEIGWKGAVTYPPQLVVDKLLWHRLQPDQVERNYANFQSRRSAFEISAPTYDNDTVVGDRHIGRTTFTLRNGSGFGFWSVDLTVILYNEGTPVAFTLINQRELKPGETRPVTLNWFEPLESVTRTEVRPSVNILDPKVFLPAERF